MAYTIIRSDPANDELVIPIETVVTDLSSLSLVGKNVTDFGSHLATNSVHMLENFANPTSPAYPLPGQLWYNTTDKILRVNTAADDYQSGALDWTVLLTGTDALQDELNAVEASLGDMILGDGTYDNTVYVTNGFVYITGGDSLLASLGEFDDALQTINTTLGLQFDSTDLILSTLLTSLGDFVDGSGAFTPETNLDLLVNVKNLVLPLSDLNNAFTNIDIAITTAITTQDNALGTLQLEVDQIEASMGILFTDGQLNVSALNNLTNINISPNDTFLGALSDIDSAINVLTSAISDDGGLADLSSKVNNMEEIALGPMVLSSGLFDNTVFSATNYLNATTSVQSALVALDIELAAATVGDSASQIEVNRIESELGILDNDGYLQSALLAALDNVASSPSTFLEALQQIDSAITVAAQGIPEWEADDRYVQKTDITYTDAGASGKYVVIPCDGADLLIQWGTTIGAAIPTTTYFPVSYANTAYTVALTALSVSTYDSQINSKTTGGFTWQKGGTQQVDWLAVGVI